MVKRVMVVIVPLLVVVRWVDITAADGRVESGQKGFENGQVLTLDDGVAGPGDAVRMLGDKSQALDPVAGLGGLGRANHSKLGFPCHNSAIPRSLTIDC